MAVLQWTTVGAARLLAASPESPMAVGQIVVGDGGGINPPIDEHTTNIVGQWWAGAASAPIRDPELPLQIKFQASIPASTSGTVRMVGLRAPDGVLLAVANTNAIEKPASGPGVTPAPMTVNAVIAANTEGQAVLVINDAPATDHSGLGNRGGANAHPMHAITGLTSIQVFEESGNLPTTIAGAVCLKAVGGVHEFWLPGIYAMEAVEVTLYSHTSSDSPIAVRAQPGQLAGVLPDIARGDGQGIALPAAGNWVTLRPNRVLSVWEVVAANAWVRDPDGDRRGMPLLATQQNLLDGVGGRMVDPLLLIASQRNAGFVVLSTTGTGFWAVPDVLKRGNKLAKVTVTGAGSGACGGGGANNFVGGGGGAGGTAISLLDLTGVEEVAWQVGAGSSGGGTTTAAGGTSSFGAYLSATGGRGASAQAGGTGGLGAGGDLNLYGGDGFDGAPSSSTSASGSGGVSFWGGGARSGGYGVSTAPPKAPGAGGGSFSGVDSGTGGKGSSGIIVIEW